MTYLGGPYMSDVEILYQAFEFTFSIIYKTTVKYQTAVFLGDHLHYFWNFAV